MTWFFFAALSAALFGISVALFKLPSTKKQSVTITTFWSMLFSSILAAIFFGNSIFQVNADIILLAIFWGVNFSIMSSLQMYALRYMDSNVLFSITTTLSLIISVFLGLLFFLENISLTQVLGVTLAIIFIYLFLSKKEGFEFSPYILAVGFGIILMSVFNKVIQKLAADDLNVEAYITCQYFSATLFAFILYIIYNRKNFVKSFLGSSMKSGFYIGVPGFFGGWVLMVALMKGPFSLIIAINSAYIFIVALIGHLFFKEKLTRMKWIFLIMVGFSVVLMRIG